MRYFTIVFFCSIFLSLSVGCRNRSLPSDLPKLRPVSITITQEGKPLEGATVTLNQIDGDTKWMAVAKTNAAGVADAFFTNGMYPGVAVGKFKVCVSKMEAVEEKNANIPPEPTDPIERSNWAAKYSNMSVTTSKTFFLVEKDFGDPQKTALEIEVQASKNIFAFDVGKPVRIPFSR